MRISLEAAVGLPTAAYIVRGILRGMDFRPDLPGDLLVAAILASGIVVARFARRPRPKESLKDLRTQVDHENDTEDQDRQQK